MRSTSFMQASTSSVLVLLPKKKQLHTLRTSKYEYCDERWIGGIEIICHPMKSYATFVSLAIKIICHLRCFYAIICNHMPLKPNFRSPVIEREAWAVASCIDPSFSQEGYPMKSYATFVSLANKFICHLCSFCLFW
jgi:hypothetical protein